MNPLVTLTIPGRPAIKKNNQRVIGFGRAKKVIYSSRYKAWHKIAILAVRRRPSIALLDVPLVAVYRFYFKDHQSEADVSNLCEAPGDMLKDAGVIADDKLIMRIQAEKFFGHEPRTEIEIYKYEEGA